jgi:hypothetical protein
VNSLREACKRVEEMRCWAGKIVEKKRGQKLMVEGFSGLLWNAKVERERKEKEREGQEKGNRWICGRVFSRWKDFRKRREMVREIGNRVDEMHQIGTIKN